MSLPRLADTTHIADQLNVLTAMVKTRSRASLTDANRILETITARFFNALFGWDLVNLNLLRANYPAADLGDRQRRIAIQVTNEDGSHKIKHTAAKAIEHRLGNDFDRLIVFFLLKKKPGLPKNFVQPPNGPKVETWDITDLLKQLQEFPNLKALAKAAEVLDEEMGRIPAEERGSKFGLPRILKHALKLAVLSICFAIVVLVWSKLPNPATMWTPPEVPNDCETIDVIFGSGGQLTSGKRTDLLWRQQFAVSNLTVARAEFRNPIEYSKATAIYYSIIGVHIVEHKVRISVEIHTRAKPIRMEEGQIRNLPDGWQINEDNNAIEIVDDRLFPVFQIVVNPYSQKEHVMSLHLRGALIGGGAVYVGSYLSNEIADNSYDSFNLGLKRVFQYPASKFPGVRIVSQ